MIRLFGKLRYHWQPDFAWSVIYWSLTFTPLFIGLSLILERVQMIGLVFILMLSTLFLCMIGLHRYFLIEEETLYIASANPFTNKKIDLASISKVQVTYLFISLYTTDYPDGLSFCMRKWPKKYFINDLARHPLFQGEVELMDHLIKQDYFQVYYADKAKSLR